MKGIQTDCLFKVFHSADIPATLQAAPDEIGALGLPHPIRAFWQGTNPLRPLEKFIL
jgi:hypothetical protein